MQDPSYARRLQRLAVVPGHPLRGLGCQFPGMALQLRQIVERVGAAQLANLFLLERKGVMPCFRNIYFSTLTRRHMGAARTRERSPAAISNCAS